MRAVCCVRCEEMTQGVRYSLIVFRVKNISSYDLDLVKNIGSTEGAIPTSLSRYIDLLPLVVGNRSLKSNCVNSIQTAASPPLTFCLRHGNSIFLLLCCSQVLCSLPEWILHTV